MVEHPIDDGRRLLAATTGGDQALGGGATRDDGELGGGWAGNGGRTESGAAASLPTSSSPDVGPPTHRAEDPTIAALGALARALESLAEDERILAGRLRELQRERSAGRTWRDILTEEEPPGTMQIVSRMLARLAEASGTLRRDLVEALRKEGTSIPAIARLFGVTHQRVSNLLRRSSG